MRNERGITLIELLAAVAISTLIIGASIMVFTSANQLFNDSVQNYSDESAAELAMNTIARELATASEVIWYQDRGELRIKSDSTPGRYISLVHADTTLTSITYNRADDTDFRSGAFNPVGAAGSRSTVLADNINFIDYDYFAPNYAALDLPNSTLISNGELIRIRCEVRTTRIGTYGSETPEDKIYETTVKLIRKATN
jgi:type II secretory pathway pseudopilin PulG